MDRAEKGIAAGPGSRSFPRLQIDSSAPRSHARVCIVTPDLMGPIRNGGVGTAYGSLALILAQAGHEVTVLFSAGQSESGTMHHWARSYASKSVTLTPLERSGARIMARSDYSATSYQVFLWLRDNHARFDVVHFPEWQGLGYYALLAKHQGLAFADISFCVGAHCPTAHLDPVFGNLDQMAADFMERESVRLADVVLSPSNYLLQWMRDDGWKLPASVFVSPNVVPDSVLARRADRSEGMAIREIVFFGRLEPVKGLSLFCDAIDRLLRRDRSIVPRITFLGKSSPLRNEDSYEYAHRRAKPWGVEVNVLGKDHDAALEYICRQGVLAVIPSLVENFPYTVLECLAQRVPFIASAVGGIPEQIAARDLERVCFHPQPDALAAKLEQALREAPAPAAPAFDFAENNRTLVRWHEALVGSAARNREVKVAAAPDDAHPLVSVCLVHHDRPDYLRQAIESLRRQDYSPFEVILADDGSTGPGALAYLESLEPEFKERGWQILRLENRYVGAARNAAGRHSRGDYLLFMDDDNYALADELSVAVAAAQKTDADILTFVEYFFEGDQLPPGNPDADTVIWVPLGPSVAAGLYENVFGDANALVKRSAFEQLGGFREVHGIGCEDWELWARAVLHGFALEVVPRPLTWYRIHPVSMTHTMDRMTSALFATTPYREGVSKDLRPALAFAVRRWFEEGHASNDVGLALEREIDHIWNSTSWRALRPVRNLVRRLKGRPEESKPLARTDYEALQAIIRLRKSNSWELTAPIRLAGHLLGGRRRNAKSPSGHLAC